MNENDKFTLHTIETILITRATVAFIIKVERNNVDV